MSKILFIAAVAAAALAAEGQAQTPAQPQDQGQPAPQPLRGNWLGADLTRKQAEQRADALFARLDSNQDGVLTRQEADQATAKLSGTRAIQRTGRLIERLFSQGDSITKVQFEAQALARFDRQDLNHDGVVTADERQQGREARQPQGN